MDVHEGVLLFAHLDIYTKTGIFKIDRKSVLGPSLFNAVFGDASNCPVVLSPMDPNLSEKLDSVVIFAKPVKDGLRSHIISYIVLFSSGVTACRLKYRDTRVASSETSQVAKHSVEYSIPSCSLTVSEEENSENNSKLMVQGVLQKTNGGQH